MQFLPSFLVLLASTSTTVFASPAAVAAPNPNPVPAANICARDTTQTELQTQAIQFAAQQADCDIFQCAGLIAAGACIAVSIPLGPAAVIACVAGGIGTICPCATCIPGLGDFLNDNGLC